MENHKFRLLVQDTTTDAQHTQLHQVTSTSVIVATGTVGRPIVPTPLKSLIENTRVVPWTDLNRVITSHANRVGSRILVIGGGLTAIQSAQKLVRKTSASVTVLSRKPLVERHFDIPTKWFDQREANIYQAQFYHEPLKERLTKLKSIRGGGSVPPFYMEEVRNMILKGELNVQCGNITEIKEKENGRLLVTTEFNDVTSQYNLIGKEQEFDCVVLACGVQPDILANSLCNVILRKWPMDIVGGYPAVSEDLRVTDGLHFVGGLASLAVGPDAANLMGISRAAEIVANALKTKEWLRDIQSNVLRNPYDAFLGTDVSSDEETESE
jgi:pyruvate/2-oxoglutarate dehydrogenase complex dihydrolipoamide dehydrogenase (E3) component